MTVVKITQPIEVVSEETGKKCVEFTVRFDVETMQDSKALYGVNNTVGMAMIAVGNEIEKIVKGE
jgi:hypothetical protein